VRPPWLAAAIIALAAAGAWAECTVREETIDGVEYITLENDLLLVRVLPAMGGAISDFELKGHGPLLAPGRITREQVIPPIPVYREHRNGWGLTDWLYPGGAYSLEPYEAEIIQLQEAPDIWSVRVSRGMVTRQVSLGQNRATVGMAVTLTNTGDEAFGRSYWLHGMYQLGGQADVTAGTQRLVMPIAPTTERRRTLAETSPEAMLLGEAPQERWSRFLAPAQPWMALVDSERKLLCATVVSPEEFNEDVVFYSWAGSPGGTPIISQEVIFDARELAPGESTKYSVGLVACAGLDSVRYLDGHLALDADVPETAVPGELRIPVRLATFQRERIVDLSLRLRAGDRLVPAHGLVLRDIGPTSPREAVAVFAAVPAGEYTITFEARSGSAPIGGSLWAAPLVVEAE